MLAMIKQLFQCSAPEDRGYAYLCFIIMVIMAIVETVSIVSIMPFIAMLSDPQAIAHHAPLAFIYQQFHFSHQDCFLIFLGLSVLGCLIINNLLSIATTWTLFAFTYTQEYKLSKQLFTRYLKQPYSFFLNRSPVELTHNILSEASVVIHKTIISILQFMAKLIASGFIILLLLFVNPILTLLMGLFLGGTYISIYGLIKRKLDQLSQNALIHNQAKSKIVTEVLSNIKTLKWSGKENYFTQLFTKQAKQHAHNESTSHIFSTVPKNILEVIIFGSMLLIIIYLLSIKKNISDIIPLLGLYTLAALRIMPAIQTMLASLTSLRLNQHSFCLIIKDLSMPSSPLYPTKSPPIKLKQAITFNKVSFRYPHHDSFVFKELDLSFPAHHTIGLIGTTGAGKTTLIDLILGLLSPTFGHILIDQQSLTNNISARWQRSIGYVAQDVILMDDSISNNIAFGLSATNINLKRIETVARIAHIHDFIVGELPYGYQTKVGSRGICLSGGQRQRIGIARALYHQPEVLILDEATHSLDILTEEIILAAIQRFMRKKTILIITHRLTTLTICDIIYVLEAGKILASGTYSKLLVSCPLFKDMVQITNALDKKQPTKFHPAQT